MIQTLLAPVHAPMGPPLAASTEPDAEHAETGVFETFLDALASPVPQSGPPTAQFLLADPIVPGAGFPPRTFTGAELQEPQPDPDLGVSPRSAEGQALRTADLRADASQDTLPVRAVLGPDDQPPTQKVGPMTALAGAAPEAPEPSKGDGAVGDRGPAAMKKGEPANPTGAPAPVAAKDAAGQSAAQVGALLQTAELRPVWAAVPDAGIPEKMLQTVRGQPAEAPGAPKNPQPSADTALAHALVKDNPDSQVEDRAIARPSAAERAFWFAVDDPSQAANVRRSPPVAAPEPAPTPTARVEGGATPDLHRPKGDDLRDPARIAADPPPPSGPPRAGSAGLPAVDLLSEFRLSSVDATAAMTAGRPASDEVMKASLGEQRLTLASAASPPIATTVLPQVAAAFRSAGDGVIEIMLSPAELGRVQIELMPDGDSLRVSVAVERPETLDLLRRHADQLLAELRQAGFAGSQLSFGQWGAGQGQHLQQDPNAEAPPGTSDPEPADYTPAPSPRAADGSGLDIRL